MGKVKIVIQTFLVIFLISSATICYFQYAENKVLNEKLDIMRASLIEAKQTLESSNKALTDISKTNSWISDTPGINRADIASIEDQVDSAYRIIIYMQNSIND